MRKCSSNSMIERWNEEGHGEKEHERTNNENEGRNFCISSKGGCAWQGVECELVNDVGLFVVSGHVITSDPREAVLDNQLGEDHVSVSIFYYLNNI